MLAALISFLTSIPSLIALIKEVIGLFKTKPSDVIKETSEAIREVRNAKTKIARLAAAKRIQSLISR